MRLIGSRTGNAEPCCEQMIKGSGHAGYVTLMLELRPTREWQPGDWYWSDSIGEPTLIEGSDDGPRLGDPVWLPPLTHWLDALRAEGIASISFTQDPDDPAVRIIRAW